MTYDIDDTSSRDSEPVLRVIVSLDVEEEGLFSGNYAATGCGVRNVALLRRLAPLTSDLGFPLTLFCAHTVFTNAEACSHLAWMRDHCNAEIAAHLHHWSTPPLEGDEAPEQAIKHGPPTRTDRLPRQLLRQRLRTLLDAGRDFQGAPLTSFRMGRWDLKDSVRPLLAEEGITFDSSVCPLRAFKDGPDHFLAPSDPYWLDDAPGLLESPVTQIPLSRTLARLWHGCAQGAGWADSFHFLGALSPNPVWHNAAVMRAATRLHMARGGKVLSLFWHSSEMLPGGSPNIPDQRAADALYNKIYAFLSWLARNYAVRGVTAAQLRTQAASLDFGSRPAGKGDW
ncbi:hypothetical protein DDIC_05060 [Desulfovibrio desulfuricans]|uniref:Polysaccharide deacetylase n=1 Tax=Desulfovibrio desulfuricans TaxID=876 RepID=A0A4P7UNT3_DESDE|nr:hypothetical protein [Desulfovibrio desulfuricans]QCC85252.1 hypothetical protein DDIC_05060 [Desulfovibrio desulfuricans]